MACDSSAVEGPILNKIFQPDPRQRPHIERIDLDQIARTHHRVVPRLAHGIGASPAAPRRDSLPRWIDQLPGGAESGEHAINRLGGQREPFALQENPEFLASPARILLAEVTQAGDHGQRRLGSSDGAGAARAGLQLAQIRGGIAPAPAEQGGTRDAKDLGRHAPVGGLAPDHERLQPGPCRR
jgi:hypothetical protein